MMILLLLLSGVASLSLQQQQQQAEEPNPDEFQQTLTLSASDTEATFARLVRTIVTLKTEFSRATVGTRLLLLTQVTEAAQSALPIEAAGDVLDFLDAVVAQSLLEHRWSRDQLEARDGVRSALAVLSSALGALIGANTLTLTDATRARSFVLTVARALVRETVADEAPFLFEDERLLLRVAMHSRANWPAQIYAGDDVGVERTSDLPAIAPNSSAIAVASFSYRGALYGPTTSALGAVGLSLFDAATGAAVRADNLKQPVRFVFATSGSARNTTACGYWSTLGWSFDGCTVVERDETSLTCDCSHLKGDFAALAASLPPGSRPIDVAPLEPSADNSDRYLWLLLLLLLLLCIALLIIFFLVRRHRRKKEDKNSTLQPYFDKAVSAGTMALMGADDVSETSEAERRDYPLPIGTYKVPDETESEDLRREDHSFALEGEEDMQSVATRGGDDDDDGDGDELGRDAPVYKSTTRLKAGDATAQTKREGLSTDIDVSRSQSSNDNDKAAAAATQKTTGGAEKELKRGQQTATVTTKV